MWLYLLCPVVNDGSLIADLGILVTEGKKVVNKQGGVWEEKEREKES